MHAADLADALLPVACPGCGEPGRAPCRGCRSAVRSAPPILLPGGAGPGVDVVASGAFDGSLRQLLLAHKERGRRGLGRFLGEVLAEAVVQVVAAPASAERWSAPVRAIVLVPVPSRSTSVRERGDDTVAALARHAARALKRGGVTVTVVRALRHRRSVRDQAGLGARARRANVAGAMIATASRLTLRPGVVVVIVDDIATTGSTLVEASRALLACGVTARAAATVAATVRRTEVPTSRAERHSLTVTEQRPLVPSADRH